MGLRNALRLRGFLSIARFGQNWRRYSKGINGAAKPVSQGEFLKAWESIYTKNKLNHNEPIGIAVSGGVDSMALASLVADEVKRDKAFAKPMAFIVDHKLREGSSEEAAWVAEQLEQKLGIQSQILPLQWPEAPKGGDTKDSASMETDARVLRYQALGLACKAHNISSLLVAHHGDDQAETILLRLISGRWRSGLRGILPVGSIPECVGLHGVHKSSGQLIRKFDAGLRIESGGVELVRPLLMFEKERLIATCKERDIPWVEDATNTDMTLTSRNAIRFIMETRTLPRALSKPGLIALSARMNTRLEAHEKLAESLFNACKLKLDLETGSLMVKLPPKSALLDRPIKTISDENSAYNTATLLLHRLIQLVTPKDAKYSITDVSTATDSIYFPEKSPPKDELPHSFTAQLVWIRRWNGPSWFSTSSSPEVDRHSNEFLLSRLPYSKTLFPPCLTIPPSSPGASFHLFDNRYWIRIANPLSTPLILRPPNLEDKQRINALWKKNKFEFGHLRTLFQMIQPEDLRYTIPAVFCKGEGGEEVFLGFPSVNREPVVKGYKGVEWEVRYKKVDLGEHSEDVLGSALETGKAFSWNHMMDEKEVKWIDAHLRKLNLRGWSKEQRGGNGVRKGGKEERAEPSNRAEGRWKGQERSGKRSRDDRDRKGARDWSRGEDTRTRHHSRSKNPKEAVMTFGNRL
ncbi:hypothetical protein GQ43DRAFT_421482 [Delitschia confertaspora ATCC 74209]|uniref:tRNA(Ile)-lysidine synthetase n=1 Tax=Delitschia confertaspora ATCC 74209 TaxID=1513339 RepID=A0A9P4JLF2_9PLEO|nr:hypothetical protein GQ43DRAFT_421482 [Delitschia confertaspora ATCC 74209]